MYELAIEQIAEQDDYCGNSAYRKETVREVHSWHIGRIERD